MGRLHQCVPNENANIIDFVEKMCFSPYYMRNRFLKTLTSQVFQTKRL